MILKLFIAFTFVLCFVHGQATLNLIGRIRDFSNHNSGQAQAHLNGAEKGIVKPTSGVDTKPVFNTEKAITKVKSQETFDQWYRDNNWNIPFDYNLVKFSKSVK